MKILVYFPTNKNSNSIETVVKYFCAQGNEVFFLSFDPEGPIHEVVKKSGAKIFCAGIEKTNALIYYPKQIWFLIRFIRKYKIDMVYSHLQQPNIIAGCAQYFVKAKVVLCRHHTDAGIVLNSKREIWGDKIVNRLGKLFLAPGEKVFDQMVKEGVNPSSIVTIPYAYDFDQYAVPNPEAVGAIRAEFPCKLLLVKVARFVPDKRHLILFELLRQLVKEQSMDIKLVLLSDGPEKERLQQYVKENGLEGNIFFVGYKRNVIDYLASADLLIHLSITEASNSIIKEAGLCSRAVVACNDVGDFDDYLINNVNAFVINKESPQKELKDIIVRVYSDQLNPKEMGMKLRTTILDKFSYPNIVPLYEQLHNRLFSNKFRDNG